MPPVVHNVDRLSRWYRRLFQTRGPDNRNVSLDLVATVSADGKELFDAFIRDELAYGLSLQFTGLAGTQGRSTLVNPPGSGTLAYVDRLIVEFPTTAVMALRSGKQTGTNNPTTGTSPARRDFRINNGANVASAACFVGADNSALSSGEGPLWQSRLATARTIVTLEDVGVLPPDSFFQVVDATLNEQFQCTWWWRERAMLSGQA